jgi:hypothetical protein
VASAPALKEFSGYKQDLIVGGSLRQSRRGG